jgi:hypothetical protein
MAEIQELDRIGLGVQYLDHDPNKDMRKENENDGS